MKTLPDSFCVLPWINLSTDVNGSLRPCCKFAQPSLDNEYQLPNMKDGKLDDLWNDVKFQKLRQAFLDGKKPKECKSCWDEEAAGLSSFRTQFVKDKNIKLDNVEFSASTKNSPRSLDLKLNNVCNLKCRICAPQASSTFLKEFQDQYNIKIEEGAYWLSNKILKTDNETIIQTWAKSLNHLEMTGGEPMASPENTKVLELLVNSNNADKISIVLNTNGTLYNEKFLNLLLKFKSINLCVSIDDLKDRLEYERYPSNWNVVYTNLLKFIKLSKLNKNLNVLLCPTVSIFNVYFLDEYENWSKSLNIGKYYNFLHYQPFFSIKNLPNKLKDVIRNKLTDNAFKDIINFINLPAENNNLMENLISEIKTRDKIRNQEFKKVFKEWGEMIMEYDNE